LSAIRPASTGTLGNSTRGPINRRYFFALNVYFLPFFFLVTWIGQLLTAVASVEELLGDIRIAVNQYSTNRSSVEHESNISGMNIMIFC
jgi:hypothetical protein